MRRAMPTLVFLCLATHAGAQERWEREKRDCEKVFRSWRTSSVERLRDCVMRWEMFRDVTRVDRDQATVVQEAFDKLYLEGTERDAVMALSALKRLGLKPARARTASAAVPNAPREARTQVPLIDPKVRQPPPPPVAAPEPAPARRAPDRRTAERHTRSGRQFFAQRKFPEALSEFLIAADSDPTFAAPLYGAASCYSMLRKDRPAIETLARMKAIDSEQARQLVHTAARDPNLRGLRRYEAFKDLTGTAVIQLLNGAGEAGMKKVIGFSQRMDQLGMPVAMVGNDRNLRNSTFIYLKPGFDEQGESIRRHLQLGLVHKRQIDWPSPYDIIVIYGAPKEAAWIDDEAEKSGADEAAKKKKAEEAAKKKKEAEAAAAAAKMKKRMEMLKMLESMDQPAAPAAPDPAAVTP